MAKPELGQKQICPNDQTKFYDLNRRPAVCPKCGFAFDPEEVVKSRRTRGRPADYEEAEKDDAVVADAATDETEEEDTERTPEIDEAADEAPLNSDDDDADESSDSAPGVDFASDEDGEDEDGADVPFLEDDEDEDDFAADDIEGIGEDEEEER